MKVWLVYVGVRLYGVEKDLGQYSIFRNKPILCYSKREAHEYQIQKRERLVKK